LQLGLRSSDTSLCLFYDVHAEICNADMRSADAVLLDMPSLGSNQSRRRAGPKRCYRQTRSHGPAAAAAQLTRQTSRTVYRCNSVRMSFLPVCKLPSSNLNDLSIESAAGIVT
jgi:hypothetical protein